MLRRILLGAAIAGGIAFLGIGGFIFAALQGLPDHKALQNYEPPVTTRVHAGDGALIAEFADEHRLFVPIEVIPTRLQQAFISAEDQNFREHSGIDAKGVARAMLANVWNVLTGKRLEGASTITQQVAGNMLTGRQQNLYRKLREGFLAVRVERALDKDRILELYLNEIYLGNRAYGVAAASLNYFDKPLDELTIGEMAYLALLPKGPANYDLRNARKRERALARRNYVIGRMQEEGYITREEADNARREPLRPHDRLSGDTYIAASHFVEEVRRQAMETYGERDLQRGGLSIRSTVNTRFQLAAARALRRGLEQYDRRHEWRGPVKQGDAAGDLAKQLREAAAPPAMTGWHRAMVTSTRDGVRFVTENGARARLSADDARWAANGARRKRENALRAGSIIYVRPEGNRFTLKQVPQIQGSLVAMDPHTGRVLAMIGGYDLARLGYNRATQASRQPGSSFKPIVYAAALESPSNPPVTPSTLIEDAPLEIQAGDGSVWRPENYSQQFYGPTTLRRGLEQSRNAMTARVAYEMGMERVVQYGRKLGVLGPTAQPVYALALGSAETTVLRMTTAYSMFVNGGRRVQPTFIDRVQDRNGGTIYRADSRNCQGCLAPWRRQRAPELPDTRPAVLLPVTAYQIVSMAEGVVQRGTATSVSSLARPLGGKTGTTNDYKDAWFIGFSPDLAVGVWVGFDQPRDMGEGETGGRICAPIFRDFMAEALRNQPATPFRIPAGVRLVRVDAMTGLLPSGDTTVTIIEAFRPGTEPTESSMSSPFIWGGAESIDARLFQNVDIGPTDERGQAPLAANPKQQQPQQQQKSSTSLDASDIY